jgi:hypothetical protein
MYQLVLLIEVRLRTWLLMIKVETISYCPTIPYRVLSPQALDRQWRAHSMGTLSDLTDSTKTVLQWTNKER